MTRVVIAGLPGAGKSTMGEALAEALGVAAQHTDDLLEQFHPEGRRGREASRWFNKGGPWVVEGCTAVRAMREHLNARRPVPADVVIWLDDLRRPMPEHVREFSGGCLRVWRADVLPRLAGVRLLVNPTLAEALAAAAPGSPALAVASAASPAGLAVVDELRALPPPLMLAALRDLELELGPEAVGALLTELGFWRRPAQRFPREAEAPAILLYVGEYGTGKTWIAVQYFLHLILTRQAKRPRIICATGPAIEGTIIDGPSGIRAWLPHGVALEWRPSKGHEGVLWIDGVKVICCSADAPGQAIGEGVDLDLRDDVAKWVISAGPDGARAAWGAASKSCREGMALAIVPTTSDGITFIGSLLDGKTEGVAVIDLGNATENRSNLSRNFLDVVMPQLKREGLWSPLISPSPFAATDFHSLRLVDCPPLVELSVAIDPSLSSHAQSCEVGIVGGGRDERGVVHVRLDLSEVLDAGLQGWPSVAWDALERLQAEHPGAAGHFVLEINRGRKEPVALLRGEEVRRRLRAGLTEESLVEIRTVVSDRDKCARAGSPARHADAGRVRFASALDKMQAQLRALTPAGTKSDRADAMIHMVNDLAGLDEKTALAAAEAASAISSAAAGCAMAAKMNAALGGQRPGPREIAPGIIEPAKVEGALPGDSRYAGPPPARPAVSWRQRGCL